MTASKTGVSSRYAKYTDAQLAFTIRRCRRQLRATAHHEAGHADTAAGWTPATTAA